MENPLKKEIKTFLKINSEQFNSVHLFFSLFFFLRKCLCHFLVCMVVL